ncbi:MAG: hypothetical protein L3J18_13275 [Candidatus Brocadia sp.]|jgi:hypothetical protein|nr:MAG: hypothetical protein L3J18_13275 [Candidatus Brocadia sp.]
MSEYQYYEFRAIDRPLTEAQKSKISALSSRAHVTSHTASFVYNYGDFRGNPEQLMSDYFDAMVYVSDWGSRRLMFRIPLSLIDTKKLGRYCISEEINARETKQGVVLDMNFHDEELADWTEGEGWLDELVEMRAELIRGDSRVLYLAWLKAAENALRAEDIDDDTLEPPVPPGLNQLSGAQNVFVRFLEIDEAMLVVAAQKSEEQKEDHLQLENWVEKLSIEEQHEFLRRLSRGEPNLSVLMNRRLHELANKTQCSADGGGIGQRTIAGLIQAAEEWRSRKQEDERRKEELARKRRLEEFAVKENDAWQQVEILINEKKPKSYDSAIGLLKELRELAEYQGRLEGFKKRVAEIQQTYSNRPALRDRILHASLI